MAAIRQVAAVLLCSAAAAVSAVGCGGRAARPSPEEVCVDGGGVWGGSDCGGRRDHCGLTVCETVNGEGCQCPEGQCWDGALCVHPVLAIPAERRCYQICSQAPAFDCVESCTEDAASASPSCVAGAWVCPPADGLFPNTLCDTPKSVGDCGGAQMLPCPGTLYCDYGPDDDGTCGRSGQMGTCTAYGGCGEPVRDEACSCGGWLNTTPLCGPEPFVASATYAVCPESESQRCGSKLCEGYSYCVRTPTELSGVFDYQCEPLGFSGDEDSRVASCEALAEHACGSQCAQVGHLVILTCPCP